MESCALDAGRWTLDAGRSASSSTRCSELRIASSNGKCISVTLCGIEYLGMISRSCSCSVGKHAAEWPEVVLAG